VYGLFASVPLLVASYIFFKKYVKQKICCIIKKTHTGLPMRHKLPEWLIPMLLSVLIAILSWLANSVHDMAGTLAVAVSEIQSHDRRISRLEGFYE